VLGRCEFCDGLFPPDAEVGGSSVGQVDRFQTSLALVGKGRERRSQRSARTLFIVSAVSLWVTPQADVRAQCVNPATCVVTDKVTLAGLTIDSIVPCSYTLGTYCAGGNGTTGIAPDPIGACGLNYALTAETPAAALNTLNHHWLQSAVAPKVVDFGSPVNTAIVFVAVDHGPFPEEGIESTVWGSNACDISSFPTGWTLGTLTTIYGKGWEDIGCGGAGTEADDFVGQYSFAGAGFRYVAVHANFSITIFDTPAHISWSASGDDSGVAGWQSFDDEIDAVGTPICNPGDVVANAGPDQFGEVGQQVCFDGSGSFATNGIANMGWDLDGDGAIDVNGPIACIDCTQNTSGFVTLFVTDTCGCVDSDTANYTCVGRGACCDRTQPGGACTNNVLPADCVGSQLAFFKGELCADVEARGDCTEHTGACCDGTTGNCVNNVPESQCPVNPSDPDNQYRWEKGTLCADLVPPCTEHTGACCDQRIADPLLRCRDGVPESLCVIDDPSQVSWSKDTLCADLVPPCTEHTGACCDQRIADPLLRCRDNVAESLCAIDDPSQVTWTKDTLCADLVPPCTEHIGACCNRALPGGVCVNDVPASQCNTADPQISWYKDETCIDVEARGGCPEHRGACCDGTVGVCTNNVLPSGCTGDQQVWYKDTLCATIVCVQHRGACCNTNWPNDGCTDDVLPQDCVLTVMGPNEKQLTWNKGARCADIECEPNPIPTVSMWGMMILTLILMIGAKLYFGRREDVIKA